MPSVVRSRSLAPLIFALIACAVACIAVSSQSLWIDECQTALKAIPPTLHGWWRALDSEHNSNMQLPLYMLYIWGWARLFGVSEVALRAANVPLFFLGLFAIIHFLRRRPELRIAALLLYCLHPFVWYYLDEARPYLMQLSGALLVSGALFVAMDEVDAAFSGSWWWAFGGGLTILCGTGLLGVPWAIGVCLVLVCRREFWRTMLRAGRPAVLLFFPLLVVLALYFAWTIKEKVGAGYRSMNIASMVSVFYDQLGFLGLGPGRSAFRPPSLAGPSLVSFSIVRPFLPPLCLLGLPLAWGLALAARRRFGLSWTCFRSILLLVVIPVVLIFALGYVRHVRILSRHLTPLFPFILAAQAYTILLLWKTGRPLGRIAAGLIVVALALSSFEIRFAPRHQKDDYRSAAASAAQALAQGKTVWWTASPDGADFYHLPVDRLSTGTPGAAEWMTNAPDNVTTPPDLIFISKPDLNDPSGSVSRFVATRHYSLVATYQDFTVWQK